MVTSYGSWLSRGWCTALHGPCVLAPRSLALTLLQAAVARSLWLHASQHPDDGAVTALTPQFCPRCALPANANELFAPSICERAFRTISLHCCLWLVLACLQLEPCGGHIPQQPRDRCHGARQQQRWYLTLLALHGLRGSCQVCRHRLLDRDTSSDGMAAHNGVASWLVGVSSEAPQSSRCRYAA